MKFICVAFSVMGMLLLAGSSPAQSNGQTGSAVPEPAARRALAGHRRGVGSARAMLGVLTDEQRHSLRQPAKH